MALAAGVCSDRSEAALRTQCDRGLARGRRCIRHAVGASSGSPDVLRRVRARTPGRAWRRSLSRPLRRDPARPAHAPQRGPIRVLVTERTVRCLRTRGDRKPAHADPGRRHPRTCRPGAQVGGRKRGSGLGAQRGTDRLRLPGSGFAHRRRDRRDGARPHRDTDPGGSPQQAGLVTRRPPDRLRRTSGYRRGSSVGNEPHRRRQCRRKRPTRARRSGLRPDVVARRLEDRVRGLRLALRRVGRHHGRQRRRQRRTQSHRDSRIRVESGVVTLGASDRIRSG